MKQFTGKHTKLGSFIPHKKFIAHPGEGASPKGMVFEPSWSEIGPRF